jgi:hypothetical protein
LEEFKLRKREDFISSNFDRSCIEKSIWSSAVLIIERKEETEWDLYRISRNSSGETLSAIVTSVGFLPRKETKKMTKLAIIGVIRIQKMWFHKIEPVV